ncbi:MAG: hypothetical protein HAW62_05255 [Endozoicomonadaceae bacterium]|nr:hypothetical protein [Endozoicomonadaceae bacterium]
MNISPESSINTLPNDQVNNPRLDQQAIYKKYSIQKSWDSFENDDALNRDEFDSYILHQDHYKRKNEQPNDPVNVKKACYSKTDSI